MKARLVPEERPDVIITMSWAEAKILRIMSYGVGGVGLGRTFTDELGAVLNVVGVPLDNSIKFHGYFK